MVEVPAITPDIASEQKMDRIPKTAGRMKPGEQPVGRIAAPYTTTDERPHVLHLMP